MIFAAGCSQMSTRMGSASDNMPTLSGAEEVPPVNTQASGINRIAVIGDKTVTGSVEVRNLDATAAHIHLAPKGQNGPVIISLVKTGRTYGPFRPIRCYQALNSTHFGLGISTSTCTVLLTRTGRFGCS